MNTWKEFKQVVKEARKESDRLSKEHEIRMWVGFHQDSDCSNTYSCCKGEGVFDINPFSVDLKTGMYAGTCLMCGEYTFTNIKKWFKRGEMR